MKKAKTTNMFTGASIKIQGAKPPKIRKKKINLDDIQDINDPKWNIVGVSKEKINEYQSNKVDELNNEEPLDGLESSNLNEDIGKSFKDNIDNKIVQPTPLLINTKSE